ncbi:MAG: RNA polymerase Rpb4 family protein [Methanobacteriaceae archaeon]
MIGKKVIETQPIPIARVKELLDEFSQEKELLYEQNITLDHATKFSKTSADDAEALVKKLEDEKGLKKKNAVRIADLMPEDLDDLRLLFAKERLTIKNDEMESILEIIDEYRI